MIKSVPPNILNYSADRLQTRKLAYNYDHMAQIGVKNHTKEESESDKVCFHNVILSSYKPHTQMITNE